MDGGKFIICMVFVFSLGIGEGRNVEAKDTQTNKKCLTPNGYNGNCINIKKCPTLLYLLEHQGHNTSIATFLINSKCGDEDNFPYYPKVCCSLDGGIYETVSSIKLPSQDTCGRSNVSHNLIVGGSLAELGAWPWMAALGYVDINLREPKYEWMCGGSLISDRYVLTAAHCTVGLGKYRLVVVRLGDLNLNPYEKDGAKPINFEIARVISHNQHNAQKLTNDISLLKLKSIVKFNQFIQPICLPILSLHRATSLAGFELSLVGWGSTMLNPSSDALMEVEIPVVDNMICKDKYIKFNIAIDDTHLCAGIKRRDACKGDSGGPLIWPNGSQYYLVGVTSFGHTECGGSDYPGVYTRVTSYLEWIADNINHS